MLKKVLLSLLANAVAIYLAVEILQGDFVLTGGIKGYVVAAILFAFLNGLIKPVLKFVALPFVFLSAGLFTLVINGFLVWFAAYALEVLQFQGVRIEIVGSILTYLYVAIIIGVANFIIHWLIKSKP